MTDALPNATLGNRTLVLSAWLYFALGTTLSQLVDVFNFHLLMKLTPGGLLQMWRLRCPLSSNPFPPKNCLSLMSPGDSPMKSLREIIGHWFRQDESGHPTTTGFDFTIDEPLRPLKAIRAKCIECQSGNINEVRNCRMVDWSIWPYRPTNYHYGLRAGQQDLRARKNHPQRMSSNSPLPGRRALSFQKAFCASSAEHRHHLIRASPAGLAGDNYTGVLLCFFLPIAA